MQQLDPKAVWLFFISISLRSIILILLVSSWFSSIVTALLHSGEGDAVLPWIIWFIIFVPLFLIVCFIWAKLSYHFYRYELTEDSFRKERGVIYKKYVSIPYDRIQNVDIYRGLLARMLGLSDLNIQTAGYSMPMRSFSMGGGSEGRLPGLSKEVAENLRNELIKRAKQNRAQGL